MKRLSLREIVSALDAQNDQVRHVLNLETGEIMLIIEGHEDVLEEPPEDALPLPTSFEINEYRLMERFCYDQDDEHIQDTLLDAIQGRGAFRRFRENILRLGIERQWYRYQERAFAEIAIQWLKANELPYIDDLNG